MNMKEASAKIWNAPDNPTLEYINAGSLQRIADAAEKMALSYNQLLADAERYQRWWKEEQRRREHAERRAVALAGHITRLRKKQA